MICFRSVRPHHLDPHPSEPRIPRGEVALLVRCSFCCYIDSSTVFIVLQVGRRREVMSFSEDWWY